MDWLSSEDLKEEKNVTAPAIIIAVSEPIALRHRQAERGVPLSMSRINPECPSSAPPDPLLADEAILRQEPDEEEDEDEEDEGGGKEEDEDDEDDDNDDGYSE